MQAKQPDLFTAQLLPAGMQYRSDFVSPEEEIELVALIRNLPLTQARYHQYIARRRTVSFGASYDFSEQRARPAPSLPEAFHWLRDRAAEWAGRPVTQFVQTLIAEYSTGTPLGWHRDVPDYEAIVGISLAGSARMRLRPYPWSPERRRDILSIDLEPRSAYILSGVARWRWQHQIPPTKELRYSITFRTARASAAEREHA